ncbi:MAG: hypothetical protein RI947_1428 [Candidatus Parcubacteria bacterium]|jgi:hypothetical protein
MIQRVTVTKLTIHGVPGASVDALSTMITSQEVFASHAMNIGTSGGADTGGTIMFTPLSTLEFYNVHQLLYTLRRMIIHWLEGQYEQVDTDPVTIEVIAHDMAQPTTYPNVKITYGSDLFMEVETLPPPAKPLDKMALLQVVAEGVGSGAAVELDSLLLEWVNNPEDAGYTFDYNSKARTVTLLFTRNWTVAGHSIYALAKHWLNAILAVEPNRILPDVPRRIVIDAYDVNFHTNKAPVHQVVVVEGEPYDVTWCRVMIRNDSEELRTRVRSIILEHLAPGLSDGIQVSIKNERPYPGRPDYTLITYTVEAQLKSSFSAAQALADALLAVILELDPVSDEENTGQPNLQLRYAIAGGWDKDYAGSMAFFPNGVAIFNVNVPATEETAE